jgi:hypothetical protein
MKALILFGTVLTHLFPIPTAASNPFERKAQFPNQQYRDEIAYNAIPAFLKASDLTSAQKAWQASKIPTFTWL